MQIIIYPWNVFGRFRTFLSEDLRLFHSTAPGCSPSRLKPQTTTASQRAIEATMRTVLGHDATDLRAEPHVQHAVSLVQHEEPVEAKREEGRAYQGLGGK